MCSDARLLAPVGLHRDLVFPGNSKVRPRRTNLHSVRLLSLKKISVSLHAKVDSAVSAQHGGRGKRLETYRGGDGMRGGAVSANTGLKEGGKGLRRE